MIEYNSRVYPIKKHKVSAADKGKLSVSLPKTLIDRIRYIAQKANVEPSNVMWVAFEEWLTNHPDAPNLKDE